MRFVKASFVFGFWLAVVYRVKLGKLRYKHFSVYKKCRSVKSFVSIATVFGNPCLFSDPIFSQQNYKQGAYYLLLYYKNEIEKALHCFVTAKTNL